MSTKHESPRKEGQSNHLRQNRIMAAGLEGERREQRQEGEKREEERGKTQRRIENSDTAVVYGVV